MTINARRESYVLTCMQVGRVTAAPVKNRWSPIAGVVGFLLAIPLSDNNNPPSYLLGVLCPTPFILGWIMLMFHLSGEFSISWWGVVNVIVFVFVVFVFVFFGNAVWYMMIVEAVRLLLGKLSALQSARYRS
jgi:hypothetical protein